MTRIARNKVMGIRRHYHRAKLRDIGHEARQVESDTTSRVLEGGELGAMVEEAIERLPQEYGASIRLRAFEQLSWAEIGSRIGRTGPVARKLYDQAVSMLRKQLEKGDAGYAHPKVRIGSAPERVGSGTSERHLSQAASNRELLAALVDDDWLGLRVLVGLMSASSTAKDLASTLGASAQSVETILNSLRKSGAVVMLRGVATPSERGVDVLRKIEKATGVDLNR